MNNVLRFGFAGIVLLGAIVALTDVPVFAMEVVAQAGTPTPTPPAVIPAWILGGGHFYGNSPDVDPGATPDQHLFAGVLDASATANPALPTSCPGIGSGATNVSNCNPYLYISMLELKCDSTLLSTTAYTYLNNGSHETAFLHGYASPTPGPRESDSGNCPTPDITPTPSSTATAGYFTNPHDSGFQSWLVSHAWTTTAATFPAPFGIYEDHFSVTGRPCYLSYEYGGGACNLAPSGAPDWETALGGFENNAETNCPGTCFAFVGNGLTPGGGGDTPACGNIAGGQCFATPDAGVVDDMDALDNLCSAADSTSHLQGITAEEIVFLKGTPGPSPTPSNSPVFANTQTIVYMINTMSRLVNYTSGGCKNTVAIDVESSGGSFPGLPGYGAGSVAAGIPVREEATALRFLVPDLTTLVPDRMQPFYYQIGATLNPDNPSTCSASIPCEVPYFFEETIVPQGPEVLVGAFKWNGQYASIGDNCPTPPPKPDSGGAVDLVATCVSGPNDPSGEGAAVFLQEYEHLYIDGVDYGPAAILLNTASATSVPISSSWFSCSGCTPLSSFNYRLLLSGGELASVLYSGVTGGSISLPCTQPTFCNGDKTVSGNTAKVIPLTIGPHTGLILLGSN